MSVPEYSGSIHKFYHLKLYIILLTVTKIQEYYIIMSGIYNVQSIVVDKMNIT